MSCSKQFTIEVGSSCGDTNTDWDAIVWENQNIPPLLTNPGIGKIIEFTYDGMSENGHQYVVCFSNDFCVPHAITVPVRVTYTNIGGFGVAAGNIFWNGPGGEVAVNGLLSGEPQIFMFPMNPGVGQIRLETIGRSENSQEVLLFEFMPE